MNAGLFDAPRREVKPDEMKKQSDSERREENEKPLSEDYPKKLFDSARRENKGGLEKLANSERREENGKPLSEDYPKKFFDSARGEKMWEHHLRGWLLKATEAIEEGK